MTKKNVVWYFMSLWVPSMVTLLMKNFTSVVGTTYFSFIEMMIIEIKFGILCILTIYIVEM